VEVVNIGHRPHIRRLFNITITYDTPPEKINRALEILREILAMPGVPDEETTDVTTKLVDTTAAEKQMDTSATTKAPPALAAMIEDIESSFHPNWVINQPDFEPRVSFNEFNAEGIDFALPTQTLHLTGDDKRPLTVGQRSAAKEEVL
jgi:MscS family membrane protein